MRSPHDLYVVQSVGKAFSPGPSILAMLGAICIAGLGCQGSNAGNDSAVEKAVFALELKGTDGTITIAKVSYVIDAAGGAEYKGEANLSSSTKPQFVIGGLPPSTYTITVSATATDGVTTCGGASANVKVVAGASAPVVLSMTCKQPKKTGTVSVNGILNVCPTVEDPGASPSEVVVGGVVDISVGTVVDPDQGPAAVTGAWTAFPPTGQFADPSAPSTTFRCTQSGPVALQYTASDGDPGCQSSGRVAVMCTSKCPLDDGDPCTNDVCLPDGTTSHEPSGWAGCSLALSAISSLCPNRTSPITDSEMLLLNQCTATLGAKVTDGGDIGTLWADFTSCVTEALKCDSEDELLRMKVALGVSGSSQGGVCNQSGYQACAKNVLETFSQTALACTVYAFGIAGLGTICPVVLSGAAAQYVVCILAAIVGEQVGLRSCVASNSCKAPQVCDQATQTCVDCPAGTAWCNGACVSNTCTNGGVFDASTCSCQCPSGTVSCGGQCVSNSCANGGVFDASTCSCQCPAGTVSCGGQCVSNSCTNGEVFDASTCSCQCPSGAVLCGGQCVANTCSGGKLFDSSTCSCQCPPNSTVHPIDIHAYYRQEWGYHQCDSAIFDVNMNGVPLGQIDLNNGSDGGSRDAYLSASIAQVQAAAATRPIVINFVCALSSGCHEGIANVDVTNPLNGAILFSGNQSSTVLQLAVCF